MPRKKQVQQNENRPQLTWLDDPRVFAVNRLPAHSDHNWYESAESLEAGESSLIQSLNGTWEFHWAPNPQSRPVNFYEPQFDAAAFDHILVPGHIELSGYGQIQYINTMYPWDGIVYRRPEIPEEGFPYAAGDFSGALDNPVGSYRKTFDLLPPLRGKRVSIRFEGVEQAFYVWLNGTFIGYAEDSFTPSEFDLTPYLKNTDNLLAVEVYKRSSAAYLEDQDFFRFSGIFRDVKLCAKPAVHMEDLWAKPNYCAEDNSGRFALDLLLSAEKGENGFEGKTVCWRLMDAKGKLVLSGSAEASERLQFAEIAIERVQSWSHQNPYLYQLLIEIRNEEGKLLEAVPYAIGFRCLSVQEQVIFLNGKGLILNGVNRHEWSAKTGRAIGKTEMLEDMACFKRSHINAVRTCHYPNQTLWYSLCDAEGIYVMSETNLESHGSWQKMGAEEPSWNVPGNSKAWLFAVLDRAKSHFELLKNHASILFWSLGNESYAGACLAAMHTFFKEADPSRLVHYEGVFHAPSYRTQISDVESQMYTPPDKVRAYLEAHQEKPFLLCEYMHDMGNSLGGLGAYMQLLDDFPCYQGGFIWDFIDQALLCKDEVSGKEVLRYGGDFGERPSDYAFSGNGLLFADRTEKPAMQEVRYYFGLYDAV